MKNLKKLSAAFMLAALLSSSLTSCIDNSVSPIVEAIYAAQADLIAAQTSVQTAEANLLTAQAAQANAQASLIAAQAAQVDAATANLQGDTAYEAAQREQLLLRLAAETELAVAQAQNDLAIAQADFELQMSGLLADLAEAGASEAIHYATQYALYVTEVNSLSSTLLAKNATLANKKLMLTTIGGVQASVFISNTQVTWEFYLALLNSDLAALQATVAANEASIAGYEEAMNNPTDVETQKTALQAQIDDLNTANDALTVAIADALNAKNAAAAELTAAQAWIANTYDPAKALLDTAEGNRQTLVDANVTLTDENTVHQTAIDNYPTALAAFEQAVTDADALVVTRTSEKATADALVVTRTDEKNTADAAVTAAQGALDAHNAALLLLDASYQAAIADYANEQALYDAGIAGAEADLVAAQDALDAGEAVVVAAQADYDAKKLVFEADPTGFVWEAGPNGTVGLHADATTLTASFSNVNSTDDGVDATLSLTAGGGIDQTGVYATHAAFVADATGGFLAPGDYYDVGTDDVAGGTNADRLDDALVALTAAQDAIPALQDAVDAAQLTVDTFGDALAAAIIVYNEQKALYDNGLATQAILEDALATAQTAAATAATNLTAAQTAAATAATNLTAAQTAAATAATNLATFQSTTIADHQAIIDANLATISGNLVNIAEYDILIAKYQADLDTLQDQYDELINTPLYAALEVAKLEAAQAWAALVAEKNANTTMITSLNAVITAINNAYTFTNYEQAISDLQDANVTLAQQIEEKLVQIALGEISVENIQAEIVALEAEIAALEAEIAGQQALADEYYALMQAALAS